MLNHITLMGRLTRDPELRRTGTGVAVANFTIAVDRDYSTDGVKKTDFINCVAWKQTGEFISKYFTKGSMIVVDGRLEMRDWTDKDGNKRVAAEVIANNCYFGEKKSDNAEPRNSGYTPPASAYATPAYAAPEQPQFAMLDDDDAQLPF